MNNHKMKLIKNDEIDIKALFKVIWLDRKIILAIFTLLTCLGIFYSLLVTPLFMSKITIYPKSEQSNLNFGQFQGMASSLGFSLPDEAQSIDIVDVINSRRIRKSLISNLWYSEEFKDSLDLISYWELCSLKNNYNPIKLFFSIFSNYFGKTKDLNLLKSEELALEELNKRLSVTESRTGLITIEVLMEEASLAADLANEIYFKLLDFTKYEYQKIAISNVQFIQSRQNEIALQLQESEDLLKEFREENRMISSSPQLQLEIERLLRSVEINTQVYITLQQQYELARIKETKTSTSVILLDEGVSASKKSTPRRKTITVLSMFIGLLGGFSFTLIKKIIWS